MKHCLFFLGQTFLVLALFVLPSCQSSSSEAAKAQDQTAAAPPPPLTVQVAQPVVRTVGALKTVDSPFLQFGRWEGMNVGQH